MLMPHPFLNNVWADESGNVFRKKVEKGVYTYLIPKKTFINNSKFPTTSGSHVETKLRLSCPVHQVVWECFHNMKVPEGYRVYHKNGDTLDNRIENLEMNLRSVACHRQRKSRLYWYDPKRNRWKVAYNSTKPGRQQYGGFFKTEEEAKRAAEAIMNTLAGLHKDLPFMPEAN